MRVAGAGPRPEGARRPYVLQLVFPPEPDAGAVVLLLDAAVEVRAHSGQARRGLFGAALEPHLLEALVGGGREPLVLPDLHPDMTRRRPGAADSGWARGAGTEREREAEREPGKARAGARSAGSARPGGRGSAGGEGPEEGGQG